MSVQLQLGLGLGLGSCNTNRHSSFNKSPSLPCVESKHLTHSLASEVTTNSLWLLGLTALTCLVSGNCNYSVSVFSVALLVLYWNPYCTPVCFLGIPAVLCTPVAVLCGVTWHVSLAGHHNLPWGRVPHTLLHCMGSLGMSH